jgi:hypothetical protein
MSQSNGVGRALRTGYVWHERYMWHHGGEYKTFEPPNLNPFYKEGDIPWHPLHSQEDCSRSQVRVLIHIILASDRIQASIS